MPRRTLIQCRAGTPGTTGRLNALKQRLNWELYSVFEHQPPYCASFWC